LLDYEEKYWKQFFHFKASERNAHNAIHGMFDFDGNWRRENSEISDVVVHYFSNMFCSSQPSDDQMNQVLDNVSPCLFERNSLILDCDFFVKEIWITAFAIALSKAPDLDGLPGLFHQKYWSTVGSSVTSACLRCLNNDEPLETINDTLVVLIPKVKRLCRCLNFCL
jgi:hypothetical protein